MDQNSLCTLSASIANEAVTSSIVRQMKKNIFGYTETFSWGSDEHGQMGLGKGKSGRRYSIPRFCSFGVVITSISCGYNHSAFITSNKCLYAMGSNQFNKLGLPTSIKTALQPQLVENLQHVKASKVSCGWDHSLLLSSEGEVFGWGGNSDGQLGLGSFSECSLPTKLNLNYLPQNKTNKLTNSFVGNAIVTSISCGSYHSALLLESGQVCSFGRNNFGQLGLGDTRNRHSPVVCKLDENIKMIAQGNDHSLILGCSERVYSCGQNNQGQLGLTTLSTSNALISTYSHITALPSNISSIAAGQHSAVVTDNGQLYLFGTTPLGQFLSPQRISLLSSANITQVSIGNRFGCAVDSKGQLYTWGINDKGQLGLGDYEQRNTPIHISSLHRKVVSQVCCGEDFIIALGRTVKPKTIDGSEEQQKRLRSESAAQDRKQDRNSAIKRYADYEDIQRMLASVSKGTKKNSSAVSYNDFENTNENNKQAKQQASQQYGKSNCTTELQDGNYFVGMDARRRINSLFSAKSFSDNKMISEQMKEQIKFQQQIQAASSAQPQKESRGGFQQPQYTFATSAIITDEESGILQQQQQRRRSCNSYVQSNSAQQKVNYLSRQGNYADQDSNNLTWNEQSQMEDNVPSYLGQSNNSRMLQQQYLEQEQIKRALSYHDSTGYPHSHTESSSFQPRRIVQSQNASYISSSKSPEKISSHSTSKTIKQKQLEFINSSYQDLPLNPRANSSLAQYSRGHNRSYLDQTFDGETDEVFEDAEDQLKDQSEYRKQLTSIQQKVNRQLASYSQQQQQSQQKQQQQQLHQMSLNIMKEDDGRRRLSKGGIVQQVSNIDEVKIRQEENEDLKKRSDVKIKVNQSRGGQENSKKEVQDDDMQKVIRIARSNHNNDEKGKELIDQEINPKKPVPKMIVMIKKKQSDLVESAEVSSEPVGQKQSQQTQQFKQSQQQQQQQQQQPQRQVIQGVRNTAMPRKDMNNESDTIVQDLQDSLSPSLEVKNSNAEIAEKIDSSKDQQANLELIAFQSQKLSKLEEVLKAAEAREQRLKEEIEGQKQQMNQGLKQQIQENQGLKQQIEENQGKITELSQSILAIQRQSQLALQESQEKVSYAEVQLAAEKQLVENLRANTAQLSHHSSALLTANTQLQAQVQYLQEQAIQQAGLISKESQVAVSLQAKVDQQRVELEQLHARSHYSTAQNEELKSSAQSWQHQIQSLQLDLKHLLQDSAALKDENYKILLANEKLNLQNDRGLSENKELKRRIEEIEAERIQVIKEKEALTGELKDTERRYSEMMQAKEGLHADLSGQNEKLRRDCDKLHAQLEDVNVRLEQSEGDAEAKQQEILTLQSLLEHLERTLNQRDIDHAKQNKQLEIRLLDEESFNYASYLKQMNQREQETQELRQIIVSLESKNKELEEYLLESMQSQNNTQLHNHNVLNSSQLTGSDNFWRTQHLRQQLFNPDRLSRSSTKTDSSLFVRRNSTNGNNNNSNSNIISTQNQSPSQPARSGSASKKLLYALSANKQNQNNQNYTVYQMGNEQNVNGQSNNNQNMSRKSSNSVLWEELDQQKNQNDLALSKFERSAKKILALITSESPERNDKNRDASVQGIIVLERNQPLNSSKKQQNGVAGSIIEPLRLEGKENRSKSLEKRMLDFERKLKESTKKNTNQSSQTQITLN